MDPTQEQGHQHSQDSARPTGRRKRRQVSSTQGLPQGLGDNWTKFGLDCIRLNADNLRNKLDELSMLTYKYNPDVILVQELLPKTSGIPHNTTQFCLGGYNLFTNEKSWKRVLAIYIKNDIKATQLDNSIIGQREESVWAEVRLKNNDKLLIGSVYRSPSATREASLELFDQIQHISGSQPSHLLITGDLNLPDINWELESSPNSLTNLGTIFMECYRDGFLYQHVMAPTHHWHGCTPTTLDLVFSNEEGVVTDTSHLAPLGASCHNVMKFKFNCYFLINENHIQGYIWNRAGYQAMKSDAELIDWDHELAGKNTQQMWDTFESKLMSWWQNMSRSVSCQRKDEETNPFGWRTKPTPKSGKKKTTATKDIGQHQKEKTIVPMPVTEIKPSGKSNEQ